MQNVTIILTPIDAEAYKLFQKYYLAFKLLDSVGAFSIKNGSVTLDFDKFGQVKGVHKNEVFRPEFDTSAEHKV